MTYLPDSELLGGLSYHVASLYGMPNMGAQYFADNVDCTRLETALPTCCCCGKRSFSDYSKHHEPPKGKSRTFTLKSGYGRFILFPALIVLCGTGTTGCHGDRHNGRLKIRWEWDSDEYAEKWFSGYLLSHGYPPHSERLFNLGKYVFEWRGKVKEVRGEDDWQSVDWTEL